MRRQGIVWLGATVVMLGAAACFSDPTKSLRNGASRLVITEAKVSTSNPDGHETQDVGKLTYATLLANDTVVLSIQVQDDQGNYFSFAAPTLAIGNATVADLVAYPDTIAGTVPGNTLWKALLIAKATGTTTALITAAGLQDSVVVNVQ